jgi:hypothetical protein
MDDFDGERGASARFPVQHHREILRLAFITFGDISQERRLLKKVVVRKATYPEKVVNHLER